MSRAVSEEELQRAAECIRAGKLVAFPTETVYGLGANALDAAAVQQIFRVKGRPSTSPLIVHVASPEAARELAAEWPPEADALCARFWPGPLTLVVAKKPVLPEVVTAGLGTVGLRMPAHPVALELLRRAGLPVAAPSANRFGGISPTTAAHVRASLGDAAAVLLDAGPAALGIESAVLSLAGGRAVLLRPGMIGQPEIEALIGPVGRAGEAAGAHPSPGMHRRHYSPATRLVLVEPGAALPAGSGALLWITRPLGASKEVRMPDNPADYAAALYSVLHALDAEGWDWIAAERPPESPAWAALLDRLLRASGQG